MNEFESNTDRGQDPVVMLGRTERSEIEAEVADTIEAHGDERDETLFGDSRLNRPSFRGQQTKSFQGQQTE